MDHGVDDPALHLPPQSVPDSIVRWQEAGPRPSQDPDDRTLAEIAFFAGGAAPVYPPPWSFRRWIRLRWLRLSRSLRHLLDHGPGEWRHLGVRSSWPSPRIAREGRALELEAAAWRVQKMLAQEHATMTHIEPCALCALEAVLYRIRAARAVERRRRRE